MLYYLVEASPEPPEENMAKKRERTTTSVSTLVQQVNACVQQAAAHNRRDLLKVLVPIHKDTQAFAKEYIRLRNEIAPLFAVMFPAAKDLTSILAEVEGEIEKEAAEAKEIEELEKLV